MTPAFLTGSRCYGFPKEGSDVDLVVLIEDKATLKAVLSLADKPVPLMEGENGSYRWGCGYATRFGNLNLLICTSQKEYECWAVGTARLQSEAPVPRERAVQVFDEERDARGFGKTCSSGSKPVPVIPPSAPEEARSEPVKPRSELIEAQKAFCKEHGGIMWASESGHCWSCSRDIVNQSWETRVVTGCPFCCRSFCE